MPHLNSSTSCARLPLHVATHPAHTASIFTASVRPHSSTFFMTTVKALPHTPGDFPYSWNPSLRRTTGHRQHFHELHKIPTSSCLRHTHRQITTPKLPLRRTRLRRTVPSPPTVHIATLLEEYDISFGTAKQKPPDAAATKRPCRVQLCARSLPLPTAGCRGSRRPRIHSGAEITVSSVCKNDKHHRVGNASAIDT